MPKKSAATAGTSAKRPATRTAKANTPSQEGELVDSDMMEDGLDLVEESGGAKPPLQAILQAVEAEDNSRAQSRATAITRKIGDFAETAQGELAALRAEVADMLFV
ncbi:hypothetical protein FRC01_003207 [Tulasnella sp. 417]|nr:hypothetical protein FRC01_003207 [Tulasnella sp. 417]